MQVTARKQHCCCIVDSAVVRGVRVYAFALPCTCNRCACSMTTRHSHGHMPVTRRTSKFVWLAAMYTLLQISPWLFLVCLLVQAAARLAAAALQLAGPAAVCGGPQHLALLLLLLLVHLVLLLRVLHAECSGRWPALARLRNAM